MQYIELKEQLKNFKIFNLNDIRKIEEDFDLRRLNEWQKKNYIKKIRQGFYIFSDLEINEQALFIIANRIHEPSYISLEMALSFYGLIPEAVYGITSVTSQKTRTIKTPVGVVIPKVKEVQVFIIANNLKTAKILREEYFKLLRG